MIPATVPILRAGDRLLSNRPVLDSECHQGLIIDDFFSLARVPLAAHGKLTETSAETLEGSPEKDVTNATIGTVAGAEVDSRSSTLSRGACLVGVHGPSADVCLCLPPLMP